MKILVLGAGVIGVTTAYYLARSGHQVTVVDRQPGVALETSFANAGMISTAYSTPWAAPGVPLKALKWLFEPMAPFKISPLALNGNSLSWLFEMTKNCRRRAYASNKQRLLELAEYSRQCFLQMNQELSLDYDFRREGTLQLFRSKSQWQAAKQDADILAQLGMPFELMDVPGCIDAEPGLANSADKFVGGMRLANDMTGDCYRFTTALAEECRKLGVEFCFDTAIDSIKATPKKILYFASGHRVMTADAYVVCLGVYTPKLLRSIGIKLPIYPVKGYSLTYDIQDSAIAPRSTIMDETHKVAITRFDDRVRVGGIAEIASFNLDVQPKRRKQLDNILNELFPGSVAGNPSELWVGLRPMTPDSNPIIGRSDYSNLFLNTGHGSLGWTLSLGSAKALTAIINGRMPDLQLTSHSSKRLRVTQ